LEKVRDAGAKVAIIDTPPLAQGEAIEAAARADLILIPCRPAAFDLHAIKLTANLAMQAKKPAFAIFNSGPPRQAAKIYTECAQLIMGFGLAIAPVRLSERVAFSQAVGSGQTAQEIDPNSKATEEIEALWTWLKTTLKLK
jgi:chromosome partitioning protein